jgi:hypothetical protein
LTVLHYPFRTASFGASLFDVCAFLQSALEAVSDVVGPDDVGAASNGPASAAGSSASRRSSRQPLSAAEGLSAAYTSVKRGFEAAAATIVTVPIKEYHRVGAHVGG